MTQYDNTNRGQIWRNDKKQTDNHPDFTGSLNVNGVEYWVSAWKRKEGAAAKAPALSFSIKPKDEQPQQSISQRAMPKRPDPISSGRVPAKQNIMPDDDDMGGDHIPF
jgi:hypothetical protein